MTVQNTLRLIERIGKLIRSVLYWLFTAFVAFYLSTTPVAANWAEQRRLFDSGIREYNYRANSCSVGGSATGAFVPVNGANPERAFTYLVGQGLTDEQAAGIVGNLMAESTPEIDPTIVSPSGYRGIAQWDARVRWPRLVEWANANEKDPLDFATQLEYAWHEATDMGVIEGIRQYNDVDHATWYWGRFFEIATIGGSTSTAPLTNVQHLGDRNEEGSRIFYAWQVYDQLAGTVDGSTGVGRPSVIALDPGHGGAVPEYTDPVTGLKDRESTNHPERADVLEVANRVKTALEQDGYSVIMLRTEVEQSISKRDRVDNAANADMAISIHTTLGEINEVWPQRVGTYRENSDGSGERVTFDNEEVAALSERYANLMAEARTETEGHTVTTDPNQTTQSNSLGRSDLPARGNISLVQLWSTNVPWVYNEIGYDLTDENSISEARKQAYADGIVNGVKAAVPASSDGSSDCVDAGASYGDLSATTLAYAWPEYHAPPYTNKKPAYAEAVTQAQNNGMYVGGGIYPGVDCGGFVTRLLIDSGFEPRYNYGGKTADGASNVAGGQYPWVRDNWQKLENVQSTADLQPGDVAINAGKTHTFVFVGDIPGFGSKIASASYSSRGGGWRAPMAGREAILASNINWYRKANPVH